MQLPLIIAEGLDLHLYDSLQEAELYLEPVDVQDGIYVGYDFEGRELLLTVRDDRVEISAAEASPGHQRQLAELLRAALAAVGRPADPGADFPELVEAARIFRFR